MDNNLRITFLGGDNLEVYFPLHILNSVSLRTQPCTCSAYLKRYKYLRQQQCFQNTTQVEFTGTRGICASYGKSEDCTQ
jgi:hypothetical protein